VLERLSYVQRGKANVNLNSQSGPIHRQFTGTSKAVHRQLTGKRYADAP